MTERTHAAVAASAHPLAAIIPVERIDEEMGWKERTVEYGFGSLDDQAYAAQVDQAIDRVAILDDVAEERHAPVAIAARPNLQARAVATALRAKPGLRTSGFADADQVARFSVAVAEVLHMAQAGLPPMRGDKGLQAASGVVFAEVMNRVEMQRPDVASMDDAEVLDYCATALAAKSPKVARELKAAA